MKPLILVSHQLSFQVKVDGETTRREMSASGVGTALSRLMARVDDSKWVGWLGDQFGRSMSIPAGSDSHSSIDASRIQPVFIEKKLHRRLPSVFLPVSKHRYKLNPR